MEKNAIKKYAVWARRELISRVSQRAAQYEITPDGYGDQNATSVYGRILTADEKKQRSALIMHIKGKGFEQVMEEIAYTWFNRFSALRFMEVNGYLPTRVRVFTDDENNFKPQILTEAINMELDGLDIQKVYDLKNANDDDALFKYMIIVQCNALSKILPGMFQRISDYTELLFPDNLLREGSVVEQMITMIPQEDWMDQVQIIGWLYQYYNSEPKDQVFAKLKKNIKITKENIPAATQLFTPDWIVRYMVENSLGRLWLDGHPNDDLKAGWKYYLDEAEQEPEVQTQLTEIRKEHAALKPEDILAIDPCQGSGHILAYMFDVLVQIYEAYGYSAREAASSIVEYNIWGLDIDERAAQLAYFSVMMKARQYDRRFFSRGIQPHVYAILESNNLDPHCIEYFVDGRKELKSAMDTLVKELHDAKEYGSILNVTNVDFEALYSRFEEIQNETAPSIYSFQVINTLLPFVRVAQTMTQKYHAVVTNPPYMSASGMGKKLIDYIKRQYQDSKNDLFAVFIERSLDMLKKNGLLSMITQHSWMFLTSYEKLRNRVSNSTIVNMIHLGAHAFEEIGGEVVQTTAFTIMDFGVKHHKGLYLRLTDALNQNEKETHFLERKSIHSISQEEFNHIPGAPIVYWVGRSTFEAYNYPLMGDLFFAGHGLLTGHDEDMIFFWHEVPYDEIGFSFNSVQEMHLTKKKYAPATKGGEFRKWYGNLFYVAKYDVPTIQYMKKYPKFTPQNEERYFKEGVSWNNITTRMLTPTYLPKGCIFNNKMPAVFSNNHENNMKLLGFMASKVCDYFTTLINPTVSCSAGVMRKVPICSFDMWKSKPAEESMILSKKEWDSFEISWDFKVHPFIAMIPKGGAFFEKGNIDLAECYMLWEAECKERFEKLKANEEELNRIYINIYGLQDELTPDVEDKDVTVRRADLKRDIHSFISYAVGCMFGRYSLNSPGLVYAGGAWDDSKYMTFQPDKDAIIPICDDEYFEDDIVGRFVQFVEVVYGKDTLEENLRFIANALGGKGSSREVIRSYFINDFYSDHLKVYQKRPIYWLFDSGKKNGFKCLIYIHRYQPDTIARIRTDYVHEQQSRYRTAIVDLESRIVNSETTGERVRRTKQLNKIQAQAEELQVYEEKIHHLADQMIIINLDDGVKANYAKFQDVLAKIK